MYNVAVSDLSATLFFTGIRPDGILKEGVPHFQPTWAIIGKLTTNNSTRKSICFFMMCAFSL